MKELKKHLSLHEQVEKLTQAWAFNFGKEKKLKVALFNITTTDCPAICMILNSQKVIRILIISLGISSSSIYDFDRKFTRILMYALEDVEETLKTRLSYTITSQFPGDPLIYLKPTIYKAYEPYIRFLEHFYKSVENNKALPFCKTPHR